MNAPRERFVGTTLLGKLRVIRVLGRGGMGAVYEVEHLKTHHRRALKVLHPQIALSEDAVRRFEREATVAGRLKSPHVVETLDAGQLEDGSAYVLMELLEGSTLAQAIAREGRLSPGRVASILVQACEGLALAHDQGIVHRDLKPGNLFLVQGFAGREALKLLDFGISKFIGEEFTRGETKDSSLLGTPAYMSPEQLQSSREVDARSDIYSLSVIAYEALAGQPPYQAPTFYELAIRISKGEHRSLGELAPDIDPGLVAVIDRGMSVDRDQRHESVRELWALIEPYAGASLNPAVDTSRPRSSVPEVSEPAPLAAEDTVPLPESSSGAPPIATAGPPWPSRRLLFLVAGTTVAAATAFAAVTWTRERAGPTAESAVVTRQPLPPAPLQAPTPNDAVAPVEATSGSAPQRAVLPSAAPPLRVRRSPPPSRTQAESVGLETQNPY